MGRVEMGLSGRVFGWGLFEWVKMGCRDLQVGAGWIQWNCGLGRVGLTPPVLRLGNSRTRLASRELPHDSSLGRPPPPVVATPPAYPALLHNSFRSRYTPPYSASPPPPSFSSSAQPIHLLARSTGDRAGCKSSGGWPLLPAGLHSRRPSPPATLTYDLRCRRRLLRRNVHLFR